MGGPLTVRNLVSKCKSEPKVDRPKEELGLLLVEHLDALASHCLQYDVGKKHFAAEIALNLRVLLLDNPSNGNRSLLNQVDMEGQAFFDTERTMAGGDPNIFTSPAGGLVFSRIALEADLLIQDWVPHLFIQSHNPNIFTPFKSWWEADLLHTTANEKFSRRRLVRQMANQDRGGHVAPGIDRAYFELTRGNALEHRVAIIEGDAVTDTSLLIDPSRVREVSNKGSGQRIARALVRQVAHEVLLTLSHEQDAYLKQIPTPPSSLGPTMFIQARRAAPPQAQSCKYP